MPTPRTVRPDPAAQRGDVSVKVVDAGSHRVETSVHLAAKALDLRVEARDA
jgi:hypothetical protein